jgi:hypothetical protein
MSQKPVVSSKFVDGLIIGSGIATIIWLVAGVLILKLME